MDDGMDLLDRAQPQVKRDISVPGRQQRIVVVSLAGCGVPAIRLQGDQEIAGTYRRETEPTVADRVVSRRLTPGGVEPIDKCGGERCQKALITAEAQHRRRLAGGQGRD
jgi:hypothetical protein